MMTQGVRRGGRCRRGARAARDTYCLRGTPGGRACGERGAGGREPCARRWCRGRRPGRSRRGRRRGRGGRWCTSSRTAERRTLGIGGRKEGEGGRLGEMGTSGAGAGGGGKRGGSSWPREGGEGWGLYARGGAERARRKIGRGWMDGSDVPLTDGSVRADGRASGPRPGRMRDRASAGGREAWAGRGSEGRAVAACAQ